MKFFMFTNWNKLSNRLEKDPTYIENAFINYFANIGPNE